MLQVRRSQRPRGQTLGNPEGSFDSLISPVPPQHEIDGFQTWIDLMVRSGILVEVCHVLEEGSKLPKKTLKKEPKVKTERATPKPKARRSKRRKRDRYSGTEEEEEWVGKSSSESSQDPRSRKPRKRSKKLQDPEPEPTTTRYSSPEL